MYREKKKEGNGVVGADIGPEKEKKKPEKKKKNEAKKKKNAGRARPPKKKKRGNIEKTAIFHFLHISFFTTATRRETL